MTLERWIRLIAGSFVTISVVLSYVHSPDWLFFTLFAGKLGVRSEAAGSRA
jgi:hypothetical protein